MELLFNELSTINLSTDSYAANEKMKVFSETVAIARRNGFRNIRSHYDTHEINLSPDYTLYNWLNNKAISEVYRNNLYGMIVLPFIKEDDEKVEIEYIESDYFFEDSSNDVLETKCLGLASAYLYEVPSISLQTTNAWKRNILDIIIKSGDNRKIEEVRNVFSQNCFTVFVISDFIEQLGNVVLDETLINPNSKNLHLADHHGKAELEAFWAKLKNNPYVVEARSTNWGGKKFIRSTEKNGVIEIVLVDSDRKYALWVQTTGKNLRETKAIAKIFEDKYS